MLPAMTSVRLESSAGTCDSQGIHSSLMVLTPIQSSAALLMSQSMPLACFVCSSSHASGGFTEKPSVIPSFCALAREGSPQFSNIGFDSWKKVCARADADSATSEPARPNARMKRGDMRMTFLSYGLSLMYPVAGPLSPKTARSQCIGEQPDVAEIGDEAKPGFHPLPAGFRRRDQAARRLPVLAAGRRHGVARGDEGGVVELARHAER